MRTFLRPTHALSLLIVASSVVAVAGCSKNDAGSAGSSSAAPAAPSASGEEGRRGHEHEWDGGHDHADHPR